MKQTTIFDIEEARAKRDGGLSLVERNNQRFLQVARDTAKRICAVKGTVTMDEVREQCPWEPLHPAAWGSVFRGKDWEWTGEWKQSKIVSRRGGYQRVWRLK